MRMGLFILAFSFLWLAFLSGNSLVKAEDPKKPENDSSLEQAKQIAAAYNKFGFQLFARLNEQDVNKNVFISPIGIALSLALLSNGAEGETLQELEKALSLSGNKTGEINASNLALLTQLNREKTGVALSVANSLWVGDKYPVKKEFQEVADQFFKSQIKNAMLDTPETSAAINKWVSDHTNDKITKMVESLDANTIAVLLNAVYFKGEWALRFDKKNTSDRIFTLANFKEKITPFMEISNYMWRYNKNELFWAVAIPFADNNTTMYIFLPANGTSLEDLVGKLNNGNWSQWLQGFKLKSATLRIPRFTSGYSLDLIPILKKLGINKIFLSDMAGLGKINDQAYIGEAVHKTFVEVNEKGAEAAAATKVAAYKNGHTTPVIFEANRPFVYLIVDEKTNAVLFIGKMMDPAPTVKATPASKPAPSKKPDHPKK